MDIFKNILFTIFCIFILVLFIWALYIPKQDITQTISQTLKEQTQKLDLLYKGVTFQEVSNGIKYWEMKARTSSVNNSTGIATLEETNGTFFSNGKPTLKFKAPNAIWKMAEKEIILIKPIGYDAKTEEKGFSIFDNSQEKALSYFELPSRYEGKGKGFFFKAENLSWSLKDQEIVCENGLWIKKGEISGLAETLKADVSLEKIKILGHPKVFISDTVPSQLDANEFDIDNPKNTLTAKDDVVLTTNQIIVKTKTAIYDQGDNTIKLMGNVSAKYKQFTATADFAAYNLKTQTIILSGNPGLQKGSSSLTGDSVIINTRTKNFSVIGKSKIIVPEKELTQESI